MNISTKSKNSTQNKDQSISSQKSMNTSKNTPQKIMSTKNLFDDSIEIEEKNDLDQCVFIDETCMSSSNSPESIKQIELEPKGEEESNSNILDQNIIDETAQEENIEEIVIEDDSNQYTKQNLNISKKRKSIDIIELDDEEEKEKNKKIRTELSTIPDLESSSSSLPSLNAGDNKEEQERLDENEILMYLERTQADPSTQKVYKRFIFLKFDKRF